jgi:hypothetical protein
MAPTADDKRLAAPHGHEVHPGGVFPGGRLIEIGKFSDVVIDVPGVGGGVVDRLAELELPVTPYNGGEAPIERERFVNAPAEDYWTLRERFEQGAVDIDPDDEKLAAQLGSIKWGIDSRGRIKIESKDDMRKRGLPSPDPADAMAIALAGRANAAPMNVESHVGESITGDLMTKAW